MKTKSDKKKLLQSIKDTEKNLILLKSKADTFDENAANRKEELQKELQTLEGTTKNKKLK